MALASELGTLPALFEAQVARSPEALALIFEDETLSYGALDGRANRLARHLIAEGIGAEDIVAILLDRSPAMIVAMLGILKAGAAYLPLDPDYPAARLGFMLEDSRARGLLTTCAREADLRVALGAQAAEGTAPAIGGNTLPATICLDDPTLAARLAGYLPGTVEDGERTRPLRPGNLAYLIYTSGSTGTAQGDAMPHRNVARLLTGPTPISSSVPRTESLVAVPLDCVRLLGMGNLGRAS